MSPKPFIIPFFIPNIGCPYRCVYCNQTSITGYTDKNVLQQQLRERISEFLDFKGVHRGPVEIAFYGGTFLGMSKSYRKMLLDEAQKFVDAGKVDSIRFSTRPDTVTRKALESLAPYAVKIVEVGAQSMDNRVLSLSRRSHTAEETARSVSLLRDHSLEVGLQIMPGLPGDTLESIIATGKKLAELRPDFARIYPTVVVKNTVLEKWYYEGLFKPLTLSDAVEITKKLYLILAARDIPIIRMGLQATSSLAEPGVVVAGPFHPAFGHMVHSAIFLERVTRELEKSGRSSNTITLRVHPRDVPKVRGLKNENMRQLTKRFQLEKLQVFPDPAVAENTLEVLE